MKKHFVRLLLVLALGSLGWAQAQDVKIGLTFSPTISFIQASNEGSSDVSSAGAALRFNFGPVFDFNIKDDKYYFSTGLIYVTKRANLEFSSALGTSELNYNLQYLQIPLTMKLYTNEIISGGRIFFQLGPALELKIAEKDKTEDSDDPIDFTVIDTPIILAAGMEFDLGENKLFGSIGYQRGLINAYDRDKDNPDDDDLRVTNQLITFTAGFVF
ncbi:MAG: hypothetical protein OHK0053_15460 [Microscillaceae bacterium]